MIALAILTFTACKKKTTTTAPAPNNVVTGFTWTENGGAVMTADSAYWVTGAWGTGIRAYKGTGFSNYFEINWATQNNTNTGAKTLASGGGFTFLQGADTYTNTADQTLNVTAFDTDKLSGNCTVTVSGGAITTLVCTFSNLPKQ